MMQILLFIALLLITAGINFDHSYVEIKQKQHHTGYPWCGIYPKGIEEVYVNNWYPKLDPDHFNEWKITVERVLGDPDYWWSMYYKGTPINELVYDAAHRIETWVHCRVRYQYYYNTRYGAWETLQLGRGNCCDHAHVMIALCRAAGIPVRYRHEVTESDYGVFYHVCVEVGLPEGTVGKVRGVRWVRMDPTCPGSRCIRLIAEYPNLPF